MAEESIKTHFSIQVNAHATSNWGKEVNVTKAALQTNKEICDDSGCITSVNTNSPSRIILMDEMEKKLCVFIDDCKKNNEPLEAKDIRKKALEIYNSLSNSELYNFMASSAWYAGFKKRHGQIKTKRLNKSGKTRFKATIPKKRVIKKKQNIPPNGTSVEQTSTVRAESIDSPNSDDIQLSPVEDENSQRNNMTKKDLQEGIKLAEKLGSHFLNADTNTERKEKFKEGLNQCLSPYKKLFENRIKYKQMKMTDYGNVQHTNKVVGESIVGNNTSLERRRVSVDVHDKL